ncbi:hypothetical protein ACU4GD_11595 [Cupriavidus basilensis]
MKTRTRSVRPVAGLQVRDGARSAPRRRTACGGAAPRRAACLREQFLEELPVRFARSFNLLRVPYPAWYAFNGVYSQQMLKPHLIHLLSRMTLIQYEDFAGQLRTLLFTPADFGRRSAETLYFKRMKRRLRTPQFLHGTIAPVLRHRRRRSSTAAWRRNRSTTSPTITCTRRTYAAGSAAKATPDCCRTPGC